jgi:hypothetical protein
LENKIQIPKITDTWLRQFISLVSTLNGKATLPEDKELQLTFDKFYLPLLNKVIRYFYIFNKQIFKEYIQPSQDNLSDCIRYVLIEMETAITNNIQIHFVARQMKFLQAKYPDKSKKELWKLLNEYNGEKCLSNDDTFLLLPEKCDKSVTEELQNDPIKFLQPMFQINQFLEKNGLKTFALLPLHHGFVPRNIRMTSRDFKKLLKQADIKVEEQTKKDVVHLTDNDIFNAYRLNKVITLFYYYYVNISIISDRQMQCSATKRMAEIKKVQSHIFNVQT